MLRPMLRDRCPICVCLSVSNVGVLWPNGCMDQDATWYGGIALGPGDIVADRLATMSSGPSAIPPTLWPNGRPSQQLLRSC